MIARARIVLLVAFVIGVVIIATEFPFRQLLGERANVAHSSLQLKQLQEANRSLESQIKSLSQPSSIEGIAHSQYGLVQKGQRSVVVLPGGGTGNSGPLSSGGIPKGDVVPSDSAVANPASSTGGAPAPGGAGAGFWARLLQRLEFWKAVQ